jgi:hypothetical protein
MTGVKEHKILAGIFPLHTQQIHRIILSYNTYHDITFSLIRGCVGPSYTASKHNTTQHKTIRHHRNQLLSPPVHVSPDTVDGFSH